MVYFQTKNPYLGIFWRALEYTILVFFEPLGIFYNYLVCFMAIWYILWSFGIYLLWSFGKYCGHLVYTYCGHLVYIVVIWYLYIVVIWYLYIVVIWYRLWSFGKIFSCFGTLDQEKSGNPAPEEVEAEKEIF
jgi:hypothetical protein